MTRYELELAQFFHNITATALRQADHLDPKRTGPEGTKNPWKARLIHDLDHLARKASEAFFILTGKLPHGVDLSELHTIEPAPWTREVTRGLR